jgi:dienelactone hydrolase
MGGMGSGRNVNPDVWMQYLYDTSPRSLGFDESAVDDFVGWRQRFLEALAAGMGGMPSFDVPLQPEITDSFKEEGYTRHRLLVQSEPAMNVPSWLLVPDDIAADERRPAILALHGHGKGRDEVVGLDGGDAETAEHIRAINYDYALQFVREGYVVIAPDHRGFGERSGNKHRKLGGRDYCNIMMLEQSLFGRNPLMSNIYDVRRCLDYLQTRGDVDGERIGAVGLSYGGTMTLFTTALEPRIKVACVSCYMNSFQKYALEMDNFCGNQTPSGLLSFGEMWDVAISIAPRPLVLESGINDTGFPIEQSRMANAKTKAAYEALGYGERIAIDEFEGGHEFSGRLAFEWFRRWL